MPRNADPDRAMDVGPFRPAAWLPWAHAQTVWGSLYAPKPPVQFDRERWDTPDGDFVDVDVVGRGRHDVPWVLHFHGLEGSSQSGYARALMDAVERLGWAGAVYHWRGCSGEPNRLLRAYHSGDTAEVDFAIRTLRARHPVTVLYAVGVSLGGNALLKWLGEQGPAAGAQLARAAAVCAPIDLAAGGNALEQGFARRYANHFLATLRNKALAKIEAHPSWATPTQAQALRKARTLREFDNHFTAPVHGFADTDDYWRRASSKPWLTKITVPTLLLNARDDPFLPEHHLPQPHEVSPAVTCEFPRHGGHVGFVSGSFPGNIGWLPARLLHFLQQGK
jgi:uncharacterized protein